MSQIKALKNNKIDLILEEVALLKSAIIGWIGKDKEGEYKQKFVDNVLQSSEDNQIFKYTDKKSFLERLKK